MKQQEAFRSLISRAACLSSCAHPSCVQCPAAILVLVLTSGIPPHGISPVNVSHTSIAKLNMSAGLSYRAPPIFCVRNNSGALYCHVPRPPFVRAVATYLPVVWLAQLHIQTRNHGRIWLVNWSRWGSPGKPG